MKEMCLECSGSGKVECEHCGGSGINHNSSLLNDTCRNCQGTGWEDCGHCDGTGRIEITAAATA